MPLVLSGCGKPPDDIAPPNAATDTPAALDAVPAAEEEPAAAGEIVEEPPDEPPFQAIAEPELGTELVDEYSYHYSPEVLETDLRELADTYKGQIELGTYGTTVRGRDLHYAVIGLGSKAIVFTGGIHGREYLASVATMNVLEELLRKQKTGDPEASAVLAEYKVYFLPSANPDGAAISQSGEITKIKANA
ncbi:MAG: hypothetical protein LBS91_08600, partial [Clostridiales Family XIII bacterium]|nr:hypothetical protein [Clostridiales Family XIII bacterium]